jgi:hypothetical protein
MTSAPSQPNSALAGAPTTPHPPTCRLSNHRVAGGNKGEHSAFLVAVEWVKCARA